MIKKILLLNSLIMITFLAGCSRGASLVNESTRAIKESSKENVFVEATVNETVTISAASTETETAEVTTEIEETEITETTIEAELIEAATETEIQMTNEQESSRADLDKLQKLEAKDYETLLLSFSCPVKSFSENGIDRSSNHVNSTTELIYDDAGYVIEIDHLQEEGIVYKYIFNYDDNHLVTSYYEYKGDKDSTDDEPTLLNSSLITRDGDNGQLKYTCADNNDYSYSQTLIFNNGKFNKDETDKLRYELMEEVSYDDQGRKIKIIQNNSSSVHYEYEYEYITDDHYWERVYCVELDYTKLCSVNEIYSKNDSVMRKIEYEMDENEELVLVNDTSYKYDDKGQVIEKTTTTDGIINSIYYSYSECLPGLNQFIELSVYGYPEEFNENSEYHFTDRIEVVDASGFVAKSFAVGNLYGKEAYVDEKGRLVYFECRNDESVLEYQINYD